MSWITIRTTPSRWEADFLHEMLAAHDIPSRVIDIGLGVYCGQGNQAALQVRQQDRWTALLLISPLEESL
ncbi:hypothetical protein V0288_17820 [Pannus brasiliensis CCIBt3594]|uniref:DUF2007 domain-containing protein n=1 Tax=Pannus brasiliensis CCIBt3594 TaxID=1427578 RepID=A0AAW9QPI7_9CHRO